MTPTPATDTAQLDPNLCGQLLLRQQFIAQADLDKALAFQAQFKGRLGSVLVRIGALSEDVLLPVLADQLGMPLLGADNLPSQPALIRQAVLRSELPADWFVAQQLVAWEEADGSIHLTAKDPVSAYLHETCYAAFAHQELTWHLVRNQDLERLLSMVQRDGGAEYKDEIAHLRELAEEAPVVELVSNVLSQAIDDSASDIHIEPEETTFAVRFRIDGVLVTRMTQPRDRYDAVASRIKLISAMDIAERRLPQDGRLSIRASGADMDVRVSAVPGVHGESIVMRLLPKERQNLNLQWLGMEADHHQQFSREIEEPHGIILVTGPTGSGKSTTLYAALDATNDGQKKIITVEDPVEFKLAGVTQIQTHGEIGYDFARALRAILRQDPDVIMIGEIRDLETAEIAVQAALTGHMVLSTLHTNDAPSAFTRLIDMGVEPFLVVSSVRAVQAQRLVRRLCPQCARPADASPEVEKWVADLRRRFPALVPEVPLWKEAVGCNTCLNRGYKGRMGIYEFIPVTAPVQAAIMRRADAAELVRIAREDGYRNLREDGLLKAARGQTSLDEVLRVTGLDTASNI